MFCYRSYTLSALIPKIISAAFAAATPFGHLRDLIGYKIPTMSPPPGMQNRQILRERLHDATEVAILGSAIAPAGGA
jgi:hypothetical protein